MVIHIETNLSSGWSWKLESPCWGNKICPNGVWPNLMMSGHKKNPKINDVLTHFCSQIMSGGGKCSNSSSTGVYPY